MSNVKEDILINSRVRGRCELCGRVRILYPETYFCRQCMRFLTKEVKTVEELRERTIRGEVNERIEAAFERAARISDSTHQGHILEEPESKFEAGIQDIIGLLEMAEGELAQSIAHTSNTRQAQILISNARRKLVALAEEERER